METRETILETANRLFLQYGIRSITMDDIAKELSISKKTIYQYFSDKDEVVELSMQHYMEQQKVIFEEMQQKATNTLEELYYISQHIKTGFQNISMSALFDIQKHYPKVWQMFLVYKEEVFKKTMTDTINRGIQEGYFRSDVEPELMALLRFEQIQMCFNPSIFPKDKYNFSEMQTHFLMHFIHGMLTDKGRELLKTYFK